VRQKKVWKKGQKHTRPTLESVWSQITVRIAGPREPKRQFDLRGIGKGELDDRRHLAADRDEKGIGKCANCPSTGARREKGFAAGRQGWPNSKKKRIQGDGQLTTLKRKNKK